MDFGVPVLTKYAMESQKSCWVSRIYNKECVKEFLIQNTHVRSSRGTSSLASRLTTVSLDA